MDGARGLAKFASLGKAWDHFSCCRVSDTEKGWDMEPFAAGLQCLPLDTSLLEQQNINTKKLYETKNNCVHVQLEQMLDPKDTETNKQTKKPIATSEKPGAKARGQEQRQSATCAPCTQGTEGVINHQSHSSGLTPGHNPTLTPHKEWAHPPQGSGKQSLLFVLTPSCCSRDPNKALPEFLLSGL